jgi:hypothetical protein
MTEGPHVEFHLLGKVGVKQAGRLGVDPGPSETWAHPVLNNTGSHWPLWEVTGLTHLGLSSSL